MHMTLGRETEVKAPCVTCEAAIKHAQGNGTLEGNSSSLLGRAKLLSILLTLVHASLALQSSVHPTHCKQRLLARPRALHSHVPRSRHAKNGWARTGAQERSGLLLLKGKHGRSEAPPAAIQAALQCILEAARIPFAISIVSQVWEGACWPLFVGVRGVCMQHVWDWDFCVLAIA